jgi:hypothetical protein
MYFTTFSFVGYNTCCFPLPNGIDLQIRRESVATASIQFIHQGQNVEIPDGLVINDETNNEIVPPNFVSNNRYFTLGWDCSYEITFDGKEVVSLVNARDWDPDLFMTPPDERQWSLYTPDHPKQKK